MQMEKVITREDTQMGAPSLRKGRKKGERKEWEGQKQKVEQDEKAGVGHGGKNEVGRERERKREEFYLGARNLLGNDPAPQSRFTPPLAPAVFPMRHLCKRQAA